MELLLLGGLHRSGTSLIHEVLRQHSDIGGLLNTPSPEDEGQHLQSVFPAAIKYGGPGKFAFDKQAYLNESSPLATTENSKKILEEWSRWADFQGKYFIEKSPPNMIRFRFFQQLWPDMKALMIFRHPLAVSYATQKWSSTDIISLLDHTLTAYEISMRDFPFVKNIKKIKYEEFVAQPQKEIDDILLWLGLAKHKVTHTIKPNVNDKYYEVWEREIKILETLQCIKGGVPYSLERRANKFGYSLKPGKYMI